MTRIPKKIHFIYKDHDIPEEYREYFGKNLALHEGWDVSIYNDAEARALLVSHMPEILALYDGYSLDVQRTDLFRIVVVYLFGGFYLDLDMLCLKSIDPLCEYSLVLGEEKTLSDEQCKELGIVHPLRIANYMFGSIAGHGFWLEVIKGFFKYADTKIVTENDVLNSTGPGLVTDIYHHNKNAFDDLMLIKNNGLNCLKACGSNSCHFGDYAVHYHLGMWRWV